MINLANQVTEHTAYTALAATVGYGLTRAFTVLNPVAGATFFGSVALAGALTDPIFNRNKSSEVSTTLGKIVQVTLAWAATPHLTPIVTTALKAISAEVLSTGALVAGSISVTPQVAAITALAIVIILGYKFGGQAIKGVKNLGKILKSKLPGSSSSFPKNLDPRVLGSTRASTAFQTENQRFSYNNDNLNSQYGVKVKRGQKISEDYCSDSNEV